MHHRHLTSTKHRHPSTTPTAPTTPTKPPHPPPQKVRRPQPAAPRRGGPHQRPLEGPGRAGGEGAGACEAAAGAPQAAGGFMGVGGLVSVSDAAVLILRWTGAWVRFWVFCRHEGTKGVQDGSLRLPYTTPKSTTPQNPPTQPTNQPKPTQNCTLAPPAAVLHRRHNRRQGGGARAPHQHGHAGRLLRAERRDAHGAGACVCVCVCVCVCLCVLCALRW